MEVLSEIASPHLEDESENISGAEPTPVAIPLTLVPELSLTSAKQEQTTLKEGGSSSEAAIPKKLTYLQVLILLNTIAGINRRIAEIILAEIGLDMHRFPSATNLGSWAGACPANHQSRGKGLSGKTRKGSQWLRQALVEAAQGAMRTEEEVDQLVELARGWLRHKLPELAQALQGRVKVHHRFMLTRLLE